MATISIPLTSRLEKSVDNLVKNAIQVISSKTIGENLSGIKNMRNTKDKMTEEAIRIATVNSHL